MSCRPSWSTTPEEATLRKKVQIYELTLKEIQEYTKTDFFADNVIDCAYDIAERIDQVLERVEEID